jgi:hypothetical protein
LRSKGVAAAVGARGGGGGQGGGTLFAIKTRSPGLARGSILTIFRLGGFQETRGSAAWLDALHLVVENPPRACVCPRSSHQRISPRALLPPPPFMYRSKLRVQQYLMATCFCVAMIGSSTVNSTPLSATHLEIGSSKFALVFSRMDWTKGL